jgi:hypothetical protein
MRNTIKWFGIIVLIAVIGFSFATCKDDDDGPQLKITITGIFADYNGMLGWISMDTGSAKTDPTVAWATGTISDGSITFNILDMKTDQPYNKTGNYFITFFVFENLDSAINGETLWEGFIMSKNIGEITSIGLSEFTKL